MAVSSVRDILKTAARSWGLAPAARLASARAAWPAIVGPILAEGSAPVTLRGRTLLVGVKSPAAAQEIRLRGSAIVRALARELQEDIVSRVVPVMRHRLPGARGPGPARGPAPAKWAGR